MHEFTGSHICAVWCYVLNGFWIFMISSTRVRFEIPVFYYQLFVILNVDYLILYRHHETFYFREELSDSLSFAGCLFVHLRPIRAIVVSIMQLLFLASDSVVSCFYQPISLAQKCLYVHGVFASTEQRRRKSGKGEFLEKWRDYSRGIDWDAIDYNHIQFMFNITGSAVIKYAFKVCPWVSYFWLLLFWLILLQFSVSKQIGNYLATV